MADKRQARPAFPAGARLAESIRPLRLDGHVVGRVRSCAYGHTIQRNVALAQLPADLDVGARVDVEVLGEPVPADIVPAVLYDPENARILDLAAAGCSLSTRDRAELRSPEHRSRRL